MLVRRVSLSEVVTISCSSVLHAPREWDDRLLGGRQAESSVPQRTTRRHTAGQIVIS
jgi:hypothetical protein